MRFCDFLGSIAYHQHVIVFHNGELILDFWTGESSDYIERGDAELLQSLCWESEAVVDEVWVLPTAFAIAVDVTM